MYVIVSEVNKQDWKLPQLEHCNLGATLNSYSEDWRLELGSNNNNNNNNKSNHIEIVAQRADISKK